MHLLGYLVLQLGNKDVIFSMFEKLQKGEKIHDCTWAALILQLSNLCLNAYRILSGSQNVLLLLI